MPGYEIIGKEEFKEIKDIFDFKFDDFELVDYNPHPPIKAPIAV